MNKKVIICLIILSALVFILGLHGGAEYYFRDYCLHKALNMFYNNGSPAFFNKPGFVSDLYAIGYAVFYSILKCMHVCTNFDDFVRFLTIDKISTPIGSISFMLPALIINNIFAAIGVCYTFLITYQITKKKIIPSFISALVLATSSIWMSISHQLIVDIPLTALCTVTIYYSIIFSRGKNPYTFWKILFLGALSGLCAATKYNGLLIAISPLLGLFITEKSKRNLFFKFLTYVIGILAAFYITNPYIFWDFVNFNNGFSTEFNHAFLMGHVGADANAPLLFHLFHNFPNALGSIFFIFSIIGGILFATNPKIQLKIKLPILSFFTIFMIMMSVSVLVFLRYLLPIIPILAIFIGYFIYSVQNIQKSNNVVKNCINLFLILVIFIQCTNNAWNFYKVIGTTDTRVQIKKVFQSLNLDKKTKVAYSDIFSNPYYNEDFLNKFPHLKDNIKQYLYNANHLSIYIVPGSGSNSFSDYSIVILDNGTLDRGIVTRRDNKYSMIDHQYFMYYPLRFYYRYFYHPNKDFYIVQINPYDRDKSKVPFSNLRPDSKYRILKGPFVEIYFDDKVLRDKFVQNCSEYSIKCKPLNMEDGYYYINYFLK